MKKIFIIGSINMDLVIESPYMPENGETITGSNFMENPGGKGANQAVAVSKLGGNSYMVGKVGKAFGRELKETLSSYGVNIDYVKEEEKVSSGIAVIVVVDHDNRIILDKGSNALVDKELIDNALKDAKEGDYVVCQLEIPQESVKYAFEVAKSKGLTTILNPAPAKELIDEILENTDYFIPNQTETELYTGILPDTIDKAKEAVLIDESTFAESSYNILTLPYPTVMADEATRKRLLDVVAEQIGTRIAVFFAENKHEN